MYGLRHALLNGACGVVITVTGSVVYAQDSSVKTDKTAHAKGIKSEAANKNCDRAKPQNLQRAAADKCDSSTAVQQRKEVSDPPPLAGGLLLPPRSMSIPSQAFDAGPPLAGPAAINGLGPIFVMPQGLIGTLKPGQTLFGFSDLAQRPPAPDGFTNKGVQVDAMGGSFGRYRSTIQAGQSNENFGAYLAASKIKDSGWRDHTGSDLGQIYGDIGWRSETTNLHLTISGSDGSTAGGPTPVQMLANDRSSSWLWPNDRSEKTGKIQLSGEHQLDNSWVLGGKAYLGYTSHDFTQTEGAFAVPCSDDSTTLCGPSGAYLDSSGNRYPLYASSGRYGFLDELNDKTHAYGVSFEARNAEPLFDRPNDFVMGTSFDASNSSASVSRILGEYSTDLGFTNRQNTYQSTSVKSDANYFSLFAADQFSLTDRLTIAAALRYNFSQIDRYDGTNTNISYSYSLNDNQTFHSVNPSVGLTYRLKPDMVAYAGYNRENRVPTSFGTMCSNFESACAINNFFIPDEPLNQVHYDNFEIGLRGQNAILGAATLSWNVRLFSKQADDDYWLVQRVERPMIANVGETWRRGIQVGAALQSGPWNIGLDGILQKSTFEEEFSFYSPENPAADASLNITVPKGSQMPNTPNWVLNINADYAVTEHLNVGGIVTAVAGAYAFNDENNQLEKSDPYAILSLGARYKFSNDFEIFGLISNVFDTQYETAGVLLPVGKVQISSEPGASDPMSYVPGDPRAFYIGLRKTF